MGGGGAIPKNAPWSGRSAWEEKCIRNCSVLGVELQKEKS